MNINLIFYVIMSGVDQDTVRKCTYYLDVMENHKPTDGGDLDLISGGLFEAETRHATGGVDATMKE